MTKTIVHPLVLGLLILPLLLSCMLLMPRRAQALDGGYAESAPFIREELARMLAPIALYPDTLLSQILMASTYPVEVVEAERWLSGNRRLSGDALDRALLGKDWDPSVKAICHFPGILNLMSERIGETTDLGDAFLAQEAEVMQMVQELRAEAYEQGNLTSNSRQKVIVEKEVIIVEPANPRIVYVPYYDPYSVYGTWWYPAYRPLYWAPSGVRIGGSISYWPGFRFSFAFGSWSTFDWHRHTIHIHVHKRPRFVRHDRWIHKSGRWYHAPRHHRGGVHRHESTGRKYRHHPDRFRDYRRDKVRSRYRDDHRRGDRFWSDRLRQERQEMHLHEEKKAKGERKERIRSDRRHQNREETMVRGLGKTPGKGYNRVKGDSRGHGSGERGRFSRNERRGKPPAGEHRGGHGKENRDERRRKGR